MTSLQLLNSCNHMKVFDLVMTGMGSFLQLCHQCVYQCLIDQLGPAEYKVFQVHMHHCGHCVFNCLYSEYTDKHVPITVDSKSMCIEDIIDT